MIRIRNNPKAIAAALLVVAFAYYVALSAKEFTWVFASGDSGDWLSAALSWQVPQPLGNPIFVLFGHFLALLPGDLVVKMTIIGNCLPAAVTVMMVYLITFRLTGRSLIGLVSAGVLLSSGVFLTQSTVLDEYSLPIMMVTLATWSYLTDHRKMTVACLGIGTAMHFMVAIIALLWLAIEWRYGSVRRWLKMIPLYLAFGVVPYFLTLWELYLSKGSLSFSVLSSFMSNTGGAGQLAITFLPIRLLTLVAILAMSLGLSMIPTGYGVRMRTGAQRWIILIPAAAVIWYYLTALDPTVWHYLPMAMPSLAIFAGMGLHNLLGWKLLIPVVSLSVVALIAVNSVFLNAGNAARSNPTAGNLYKEYSSLPSGSEVAVPDYGWIGFTFRYVRLSSRPDLRRVDP